MIVRYKGGVDGAQWAYHRVVGTQLERQLIHYDEEHFHTPISHLFEF